MTITLAIYSCVPTHKIYLEKYKNPKYTNLKYDLRLKYLNDSSLIKLKYGGDFGITMSVNYELKRPVQNGRYQVFINDTLMRIVTYKSGKITGKEQTFSNQEKSVRRYKMGALTGIGYSYDKYGNITEKLISINGRLLLRSSYDTLSELKSHRFYIGQKEVRIERRDSIGHNLKVDDKYHQQEKSIEVKSSRTERKYSYSEGNFIATYKGFEIVNCKWVPTYQPIKH